MGGANAVMGATGALTNGVGSYMNYNNQQKLLDSFQTNSGNATTYNAYTNPGVPQMYAYGSGAPAGTSVMVDGSGLASSYAPAASGAGLGSLTGMPDFAASMPVVP